MTNGRLVLSGSPDIIVRLTAFPNRQDSAASVTRPGKRATMETFIGRTHLPFVAGADAAPIRFA